MLSAVVAAIALLNSTDAITHFRLLPDLLALPLLLVSVLAGLVALGGWIGLHRDSLETSGIPYFATGPRERSPGAFTRVRRLLLNMLPGSARRLRLHAGEWVRVRPLAEIYASLDADGRLDGLPFMPEMARYCGKHFKVFRRVERIHYYFDPAGAHLRRMHDAVLLDELRCDGGAHGGCQAACQIIWKEAWLSIDNGVRTAENPTVLADAMKLEALDQLTRVKSSDGDTRYVCQMTTLPDATVRTRWSDPRHFLTDLWSGNIRFDLFVTAISLALFNMVQRRMGGALTPYRENDLPKVPPAEPLNLQPGELVRVKSRPEIERTLTKSRNRGLWFDVEMHRFCGGEFRVASRVTTMVEEATGRILSLKNPCLILEGVAATGEYQSLCPQNELIYWREAWLTRVGNPDVGEVQRSQVEPCEG
ncbi:hypothetical protein [Hyphomicrobium sp. 99]|uniref:hypothetical protein n=1 Tax=Hyphomicrobium sp. 99 TaxID=1163419 RepID=UPI0012E08FC8|nr:hypothetical protein [Hyphomicrobium sp. 99]